MKYAKPLFAIAYLLIFFHFLRKIYRKVYCGKVEKKPIPPVPKTSRKPFETSVIGIYYVPPDGWANNISYIIRELDAKHYTWNALNKKAIQANRRLSSGEIVVISSERASLASTYPPSIDRLVNDGKIAKLDVAILVNFVRDVMATCQK